MTHARLTGPAFLVLAGFFAFLFWLVGILPLMAVPLPYPAGTEPRRFIFGIVLPLAASAMLLGGSLSGIRRRRAARESWISAGSVAFGVAAACGALGMTLSLFLVMSTR